MNTGNTPKGTTPQVDPRPGKNPGCDDANPRSREDVPRRQEDARGENFGRVENPEAGGLDRDPGAGPDPASEES